MEPRLTAVRIHGVAPSAKQLVVRFDGLVRPLRRCEQVAVNLDERYRTLFRILHAVRQVADHEEQRDKILVQFPGNPFRMVLEFRDQSWRTVKQNEVIESHAVFSPVARLFPPLDLLAGVLRQLQFPVELVVNRDVLSILNFVKPVRRLLNPFT